MPDAGCPCHQHIIGISHAYSQTDAHASPYVAAYTAAHAITVSAAYASPYFAAHATAYGTSSITNHIFNYVPY